MYESGAPDRAIRTEAGCDLGVFDPQLLRLGYDGSEVDAGTNEPG
jgi:hypothetical protein